MSGILSGTVERTNLVGEVDQSRSTVYRSLDSLEEHDLITEKRGKYTPTPKGKLLFQEISRVWEIGECLNSIDPLLDCLPVESIDPRVFENAKITTASRYSPDDHVKPLIELLSTSDSVRLLIPSLSKQLAEVLSSNNLDGELIIESDGFDHLLKEESSSPLNIVSLKNLDVYIVNKRLPVGIAVSEGECDEMAIILYKDGRLHGIVENSSRYSIHWAKEYYTRFRSIAHLQEPSWYTKYSQYSNSSLSG